MTKEYLAMFGITIETDEIDDEEGKKLIKQAFDTAKTGEANAKAEAQKLKGLNDNYSSQIAEYKRKEQANMTDEEKRRVEMEELKKSNQELERKFAVQNKVSSLVALGYDKETAEKYANDELDGKDTIVYQQEFLKKRDAQIRADILKEGKDPKTNGNDTDKALYTRENFKKGLITMEQMNKLKETDPALYREVLGLPAENK